MQHLYFEKWEKEREDLISDSIIEKKIFLFL